MNEKTVNRIETITIRVTEKEKQKVSDLAYDKRMVVSEFIRTKLLKN